MKPCLLRGIVPSIWTYAATKILIRMPPDGVLRFEFKINIDRRHC